MSAIFLTPRFNFDKVRSSKNIGIFHQEVLMWNHTVMRKEIDPPTDHKSEES